MQTILENGSAAPVDSVVAIIRLNFVCFIKEPGNDESMINEQHHGKELLARWLQPSRIN
jgi:hypothetical protein